MTKEQEVIEKLTNGREEIDLITLIRKFKKEGIENFVVTKKEYIETALNMLKEKDRQIDLMANYIVDLIKYNNPEEKREVEEIKQYFERKCEE